MDQFNKKWITNNALAIIEKYDAGVLTIRGLHYQLVNKGMTNTLLHYKRVVSAMISARREGIVRYYTFSDHDRGQARITSWEAETLEDKTADAKHQIKLWMKNYSLNRWSNQTYYPEIWIEKKALLGTFADPCRRYNVGLAACKGYPSLTFLYESSKRFKRAETEGHLPIILYFGDYDPSGEDIPRSIQENLAKDFDVEVEVRRIALNISQVKQWNLPAAPVKKTDSRTAGWDGIGQVELDAVLPEDLAELVGNAVEEIFDLDLHDMLMDRQQNESEIFISDLKSYVKNL